MSDFKLAKKVKIVRMSNEYSRGMEFHEGLNKNESRLFLYLGNVNNIGSDPNIWSTFYIIFWSDPLIVDTELRQFNNF